MKTPLALLNNFFLCLLLLLGMRLNSQTTDKPNILFVISDDLNDYLEGYDANINTLTPNLNLVRENGTVFLNAYASAPICAPSRTSFLSGKDLGYTQVYKNSDNDYKCMEFSDNFTAAEGNEVYFTLPQYLKDSLGYYTYNLNKVFHCQKNYIEFDELTADPCAKSGAWNKYFYYNDSIIIQPAGVAMYEGVPGYDWAPINDTLEKYMTDYIATDSVINFINKYAASPDSMCNKPFMIMLGYQKPHAKQFIPAKYFAPEYVKDFYAVPLDLPYNYPTNSYPANGINLPSQPDTPFADLEALFINTISPLMVKKFDTNFIKWPESLPTLPDVDPSLTEEERIEILQWAKRANGIIAYEAAIQFVDAQFGKIYATLLSHPEVMSNTIIIFIGDNGYGLGEKRHWSKYGLWDTDVRIPMLIADMRNPNPQICNRTVSLLDLFPTLVDINGGTMPYFPDGTTYLDGKSIAPLLQNADTIWNRPVLSATKKELVYDKGDCFPHYSVRDERFHLITYRTNGDIIDACDSATSVLEYELYDIGINRETDPYEWHNIAYQPDYAPVINYLNQWLPTGPLYLQKTYSINIQDDLNACIVDYGENVPLHFELFDTIGTAVTSPVGYIFQWTNNLSSDTLYGNSIEFPTTLIDATSFANTGELIIYLEMVDITGQIVSAFDMTSIQINAASTPSVSFDLAKYGDHTIKVENFVINGTYKSYFWDFGFGPMFYNAVPGPIYLDDITTVNVSCFVNYGNNDSCKIETQKTFYDYIAENFVENGIWIFPNPANGIINIVCDSIMAGAAYTIYDTVGNIVIKTNATQPTSVNQINITGWPMGIYYLVATHGDFVSTGNFVVTH